MAGSDGAGGQAETSLSLQPGQAGKNRKNARNQLFFAAIPEMDARSKGRELGSVFGSQALWIFALK